MLYLYDVWSECSSANLHLLDFPKNLLSQNPKRVFYIKFHSIKWWMKLSFENWNREEMIFDGGGMTCSIPNLWNIIEFQIESILSLYDDWSEGTLVSIYLLDFPERVVSKPPNRGFILFNFTQGIDQGIPKRMKILNEVGDIKWTLWDWGMMHDLNSSGMKCSRKPIMGVCSRKWQLRVERC